VQELSPSQVETSSSTQGRVEDYGAVRPDILHHPALGQGFGTYIHEKNRVVDNELLKRALETGVIGLVTYLFMVIAVMMVAHRSIRSHDPVRAGPALAASAGALAYGVAGLLFDEFFCPQAPYLFFFTAAIVVVLATPRVRTVGGRISAESMPFPTQPAV
jgi:O-antigen ligase